MEQSPSLDANSRST